MAILSGRSLGALARSVFGAGTANACLAAWNVVGDAMRRPRSEPSGTPGR